MFSVVKEKEEQRASARLGTHPATLSSAATLSSSSASTASPANSIWPPRRCACSGRSAAEAQGASSPCVEAFLLCWKAQPLPVAMPAQGKQPAQHVGSSGPEASAVRSEAAPCPAHLLHQVALRRLALPHIGAAGLHRAAEPACFIAAPPWTLPRCWTAAAAASGQFILKQKQEEASVNKGKGEKVRA